MSTFQLSPSADDFYEVLGDIIKDIKPKHRVKVLVPRSVSHEEDYYNWDELENIQMDCRGSVLDSDVFVVLRFDQKNKSGDVVVDVCHL